LDFRAGIGHASYPEVVMRPLHRVLFVFAAFVAFQGVQACASETPDPGLNPQPLPPEDQKDSRTNEEAAQDPNGSSTGAGGGSTSSGGTSPPPAADGDAGDGGGDSGGDN
jgi:hypothetical protein